MTTRIIQGPETTMLQLSRPPGPVAEELEATVSEMEVVGSSVSDVEEITATVECTE